jgi:hypothetical protein
MASDVGLREPRVLPKLSEAPGPDQAVNALDGPSLASACGLHVGSVRGKAAEFKRVGRVAARSCTVYAFMPFSSPIMAKLRWRENELLPGGVAHVAPGFALPRHFAVRADVEDDDFGALLVEVEVELREERARARRVSVETERDVGIGSGTLRAVPVREVIFKGVVQALLRIELTEDGPAYQQGTFGELTDEEHAVVKRLVGYVDGERS